MSTVRIGIIAICAAIGASGYLSLRNAATEDSRPAQPTRAQAEHPAASGQGESRNATPGPDGPMPDNRTLASGDEPAVEPDESALLEPTQTLDGVLGAVNADIGPDGEYVDREKLAAVLISDPELGRLLDESEF